MLKGRVVLCFALVILTLLAGAVSANSDWTTRPGTIGHALLQSDGSQISLDAVVVDKVHARQAPAYFTVRECFDWKSCLIIYSPPSPRLRPGQTVDIVGTLTTLPNGFRAVTCPTVTGYTDREGALLYHGPLIKGPWSATPWQWKTDLTVSETSSSMMMVDSPMPPDEPNPSSAPAPVFCSTIADAKAQYSSINRVQVELQCRPFSGATSTQFTLGQDDPSDSITVYYTGSSTLSGRINRIVGVIQKNANNSYWIEVDSGPNWQAGDVAGSVQAIPNNGSIAYARTLRDGMTATITQKTVTADTYDVVSGIYVEEPTRTTGIRIAYTGANVSRGALVSITGTMNTAPDGEREINAGSAGVTVISEYGSIPAVIGMNNRDLGCGNFNYLTPGITAPAVASGIYNKGLLIKTWGRVTYVDQASQVLFIDDGSAIQNGTGQPVGVKVTWSAEGGTSSVPIVGTYLADVIGINGSEVRGSGYARLMRVRNIAIPVTVCAAQNAAVDITWTPQDNTSYRVYRGTSSSGPFTLLASVGGGSYRDTTVSNGTTYYYKVAGVVAGVEGSALVRSVVPRSSEPSISITSAEVTDGVLHVYFTVSGGWTPENAALLIDGDAVDFIDPSYEPLHLTYQTTESTNGPHTVSVELSAGTDPTLVCSSSTTVVFNNELTCFSVADAGDDAASNEAMYVYGVWSTARPWTVTITDAYGNLLKTTTGNSQVVDYTWDGTDQSGNPTYGDSMYFAELTTGTQGIGIQSTSGRSSGKNAAYRPRKRTGPPYYLVFHPSQDQVGLLNGFKTRCGYASNALKFRYQSVTNSQNAWQVAEDGWEFPMLGDDWFGPGFLDLARIVHYTGHGSPSSIAGNYGSGGWWGYTPTYDSFGGGVNYYGLGQHFQNYFGGRCKVTGRIIDINLPIRFRMVFLDGCNTGNSARLGHLYWPMTFGIVKTGGKVSKGSGFIGWTGPGYVYDPTQSNFINYFWRNLVTNGQTLQQSVDNACKSSGLARSYVRLVGDRSMRL